MQRISRAEVIKLFGKSEGSKAVSKVDRLRPVSTGVVLSDSSLEYMAGATVPDFEKNMIDLSVYYSIPMDELPPNGIFKIRQPILVPTGYSYAKH